MLRASAQQAGRPLDLSAIAHTDRDSLVRAGRDLVDFATALIRRDDSLASQRDRLVHAVGVSGMVRAVAVAGNFEMMNRLVDATGVPTAPSRRAIAADLELPAWSDADAATP